MTQLNIRSERQDRTVHTVTVDEPTLLKLVLAAVGEQLGVDTGAVNVTAARAYASSYTEGSLASSKMCVKVELVIDHSADKQREENREL